MSTNRTRSFVEFSNAYMYVSSMAHQCETYHKARPECHHWALVYYSSVRLSGWLLRKICRRKGHRCCDHHTIHSEMIDVSQSLSEIEAHWREARASWYQYLDKARVDGEIQNGTTHWSEDVLTEFDVWYGKAKEENMGSHDLFLEK